MPIESENINTIGVLGRHISKLCEHEDRGETKQTHHNVESMQSDERIVSSPKEIRLNCETFVVNQVAPLERRSKKECSPKGDRQKPPPGKYAELSVLQGPHSQVNRCAARKEADREEDGDVENRLCWAGETLAHIEEVGDDEDCKNCRLGRNQAVHPEPPTLGGGPPDFGFEHRNRCCTHQHIPFYSYFQSRSSGCLRSHSGRRLLTDGITAKLYAGGGELVAHSRVHASHGSLPAIFPLK